MKTLSPSTTIKDITADWIKEFSKSRQEPSWALDLRLKAFAEFSSIPWPSPKDEKWKRIELNLLHWDTLQIHSSQNGARPGWISLDEAVRQHESEVKEAWESAVAQAQANKYLLLNLS